MKMHKYISTIIGPAITAIVLGAMLSMPLSWANAGGYIDVDLSKPEVELTASFDGAELLLFGVRNPGTDVIVVVRGPGVDTPVRRKERIGGIWVNNDEVVFKNALTFYSAASTMLPSEILPVEILNQYEIGVGNIKFKTRDLAVPNEKAKIFSAGLIRNMVNADLYSSDIAKINKVGQQLFRTNLWFPSNVFVGDYVVTTLLVKDGKVINTKATDIVVHKVGIEADVYNFAHDYALLYGLLAIVIAVVSGWMANAAFRKG